MGPLVPDVIGNQLNLVVALFVGIAFGFVLEQAGFSTSKKLVGLFYGYDFTVLRVFMTAGVTAMIGVVALDHFGLLDISQILINPTFLWSAIVGGIIMGLGFVIGGFCPGTSVCAAAIGKIDAMIFIAGSLLGVLVFAEGYPMFEGLYKAANWGNVQIFNTLGMSQSLFAFLLTAMAVGAFWGVTVIEAKVNGKMDPEYKSKKLYYGLTILAGVIALSAFVMPDRKDELMGSIQDKGFVTNYNVNEMTSDELAFRIMDSDQKLQIFDLRAQKEFDSLALPFSARYDIQNFFDKETGKKLSYRNMKNVFVANDEYTEKQGAVLAKELGFHDIYVLKGGLNGFRKDILNFEQPGEPKNRRETDTYRFRNEAKTTIPVLIKEYKQKQAPKESSKPKRKLVGC